MEISPEEPVKLEPKTASVFRRASEAIAPKFTKMTIAEMYDYEAKGGLSLDLAPYLMEMENSSQGQFIAIQKELKEVFTVSITHWGRLNFDDEHKDNWTGLIHTLDSKIGTSIVKVQLIDLYNKSLEDTKSQPQLDWSIPYIREAIKNKQIGDLDGEIISDWWQKILTKENGDKSEKQTELMDLGVWFRSLIEQSNQGITKEIEEKVKEKTGLSVHDFLEKVFSFYDRRPTYLSEVMSAKMAE